MKDTARVLGRMFDGIEYRGSAHENVEILARYAGVPVWNGLTDQWHPTQMLADMLTMRDHSTRALPEVAYCYLGDARNNTANSLLVTGALLGMDVRVAAPAALWPSDEVRGIAERLACSLGGTPHGHRRRARGRPGRGLPLHGCLVVDGGARGGVGRADQGAAPVPGQCRARLGDEKRGREVPALPPGAPQPRHRSRRDPLREVGLCRRSRSPTTSSSPPPQSSSTRPRTACTPSRRSWWPRQATDDAPGDRRRRERPPGARRSPPGGDPGEARRRRRRPPWRRLPTTTTW